MTLDSDDVERESSPACPPLDWLRALSVFVGRGGAPIWHPPLGDRELIGVCSHRRPSLSCPPSRQCVPSPSTCRVKGMAMTTIAEEGCRASRSGVDTHRDSHAAVVLDAQGRLLATRSFATTRGGHSSLERWATSFRDSRCVRRRAGGGPAGGGPRRAPEAARAPAIYSFTRSAAIIGAGGTSCT